MAYPPHLLLQFGGALHTVDEWSCNLRFVPNTGQNISTSLAQQFAEDCWTDIAAWLGRTPTGVSTAAELDYVKANMIGPDGRYVDPTNSVTYMGPSGSNVKGVGTPGQAPQVALAVTLHTDAQRGYASKGRIFLPAQKFLVGDSGQLTATNRDGIATSFQTLVNDLNNNPGMDAEFGGLDVHVVSDGGNSGVGVARKVTHISVGLAYDTQRRRRLDVPEGPRNLLPVS